MSAQFFQPHLCGQRFSRSDGKGAVATGAVAVALVLSHLLQRTFGRGVRLERVRDCLGQAAGSSCLGLGKKEQPRLFGFGNDECGNEPSEI